jgi:putative membrane protein insertion efficiency factor
LRRLLLQIITFYQRRISPLAPGACRFYPSCSAYAADAIREHGSARGGWLAVRRLARCHPLHPGGSDPVPPPADKKAMLCGDQGAERVNTVPL